MDYRTIVLQHLKSDPAMYRTLRDNGLLFRTLSHYEKGMAFSHREWERFYRDMGVSLMREDWSELALQLATAEMKASLSLAKNSGITPVEALEKALGFIHGR